MRFCLVLVLLVAMPGCSKRSSSTPSKDSSAIPPITPKLSDAEKKKLLDSFQKMGKTGIFASFVSSVSNEKHSQAFAMLHPNLRKAWTLKRFTQDWKSVRAQSPKGFTPRIAGSFSGASLQGKWQQVSFRMDPQSKITLSLTSMKGAIVKIEIRMPDAAVPAAVSALTNQFTQAMRKGDFKAAQDLIAAPRRKMHSMALLKQSADLLGTTNASVKTSHRLLSVNTVWYHEVVFLPKNMPASHMQLVIQSTASKTEIIALTSRKKL